MGMEQLTGKDNKKARNAKSREVADMKKTEDFTDAERVLAGKEPLSEKWKSGEVKVEKKEEIVLENVVKDAYVAPKSIAPKKEKKEKKEEISGDAKEDKKKAKGKGPKGDPEESFLLTQGCFALSVTPENCRGAAGVVRKCEGPSSALWVRFACARLLRSSSAAVLPRFLPRWELTLSLRTSALCCKLQVHLRQRGVPCGRSCEYWGWWASRWLH